MINYLCPRDTQPLLPKDSSLHCTKCKANFIINESKIALLDVIQLPEANAFDEQHEKYDSMSDEEIHRSKMLAERYMRCALKDGSTDIASVLDVACGKGELTIGLGLHPKLVSAGIAAFDHSIASMEAMARTANKLKIRERLQLSTQDISALGYELGSFDLIFGNAVLHHFLHWQDFITSVSKLLKPNGVIVLAEPLAAGYAIPMIVFKMAGKLAGLSEAECSSHEMGWYNFILDNIGTRIRARSDTDVLKSLTDKHFFCLEEILRLANKLGFQVETEQFENPDYYENMIDDFLATYKIIHPEFIRNARSVYTEIREYMGEAYATIFSHFNFITLRKI